MIKQCSKCESEKLKMIFKQPHFGLYCNKCNCWLGWIKKEELPFYMNDNVTATDEVKNLAREKLKGKTYIYDVDLDYVFDNKGEKGICLNWNSSKGFGQLIIGQYKDNGEYFVDTEGMSNNEDKQFIKNVLSKFIEKLDVIG